MIREMDAAADWLTVTTRTYRDTEVLRRIAALWIGEGKTSHPWRFMGYHGRRLHHPGGRGGVAFAEHSEGSHGVLQTWGEMTDVIGRRLADHRLRATRVDLAVTVLHDAPQPPISAMLAALPRSGVAMAGIVPISEEGGTLYVGKRTSDKMGRLYDKGSQLGDDVPPCQLWRFEVEYKRKCAEAAAEQTFYTPMTSDVRRQMIVSNVAQFFRDHAVPVELPDSSHPVHGLVRYATRVQDSERTLKWLSEQVRPAILRLSLDGQADRVWDALGIGVQDGFPYVEAESEEVEDMPTLWDWLDKYGMRE